MSQIAGNYTETTDKRILVLVCLNMVLYVLILILDVTNASRGITVAQGLANDFFKYAAIVSCFCICLFALSHSRRDVSRIQAIVFAFTMVADIFLLFTPFFAAGVLCFIGAHSSALQRYKPRWTPFVAAGSAALFVLVFVLLPRILRADMQLTFVIAACSAYAVLIITVTVSTFFAKQPPRNMLFSRIGMLMFLACDINVAIFNGMPAGTPQHTASIYLMWLFYLPAQTLLALSATDLPLIKRKYYY